MDSTEGNEGNEVGVEHWRVEGWAGNADITDVSMNLVLRQEDENFVVAARRRAERVNEN